MKKHAQKLQLSRDTLRLLEDQRLDEAVGGIIMPTRTVLPTCPC